LAVVPSLQCSKEGPPSLNHTRDRREEGGNKRNKREWIKIKKIKNEEEENNKNKQGERKAEDQREKVVIE
jgi:hypothetical protein